MRARKKNWAPAVLSENPRIIRETENIKGSLKELFKNDNPIHVEIGCGKGRFITETSKINHDINYIAIEREAVILAAAAKRAEEVGAGSLYFMHVDVNDVLDYFNPGEVKRLYINFCDPWPTKKKRARRRLTHDNFITLYEKLEIPEIHFKTDNRILFEFSLESFCRKGWLLENVSLDLHNSGIEGNIMTEYEEKFSAKGPIYRLEAYPRKPHII